jgi:hypothetical protein
LALHLKDPEANAAVLKIADEYDHLAVHAARREKHECDLVAPKGITRGEVR